MKKLNRLILFSIIVSLIFGSVYIMAQQRAQRPQRMERPQIDPEQIIQRRMERIIEELKLSEDETTVLKPKIENILRTNMEQSLKTRELTNALREALNADDDAQIKEKLELLKTKRKEQSKKVEKLEKELVQLLSVKQEAQLTVLGVVNSDGVGGFFGGFRTGPNDRQQRPRRGGMQ